MNEAITTKESNANKREQKEESVFKETQQQRRNKHDRKKRQGGKQDVHGMCSNPGDRFTYE